jgi:hypothetical protein
MDKNSQTQFAANLVGLIVGANAIAVIQVGRAQFQQQEADPRLLLRCHTVAGAGETDVHTHPAASWFARSNAICIVAPDALISSHEFTERRGSIFLIRQ